MARTPSLASPLMALGVIGAAMAQPALSPPISKPVQRTILQTFDVPGTRLETVIALVELAPNVTVGRHTHPGTEAGYIIEGEATRFLQGQPEKLVKAGESFQIPQGAVHDWRSGPRGTKVIVTYVVDRSRPLASDAY